LRIKITTIQAIGALALLVIFYISVTWVASIYFNSVALIRAKEICRSKPHFFIYNIDIWNKLKNFTKDQRNIFEKNNSMQDISIGQTVLDNSARIVVFHNEYRINGQIWAKSNDIKVFYKYPIGLKWLTPGYPEFGCLLSSKSEVSRVLFGY
jgi:hypothetical protein